MKISKLWLLIIFVTFEASAKMPCDDANAQFLSGNRTQAVSMFTALARSGNACGYEGLGEAYMKGIGVKKDLKKALIIWRKAKEIGSTMASLKITFLENAMDEK